MGNIELKDIKELKKREKDENYKLKKNIKKAVANQFNNLKSKEDRQEYINHIKYKISSYEELSNDDLHSIKEDLIFFTNIITWVLSLKDDIKEEKRGEENNI